MKIRKPRSASIKISSDSKHSGNNFKKSNKDIIKSRSDVIIKTSELLEILKHAPNVTDYLEQESENLATAPLHELLKEELNKKGLSPGELAKLAGTDRVYTYQILSGQKTPSRDKVLALCMALQMSFEDTQDLLKRTGYPPLYPRIEKDSVLIFAFQRGLSIIDANELLYEMGIQDLLG